MLLIKSQFNVKSRSCNNSLPPKNYS